jgi:hypothetical protein
VVTVPARAADFVDEPLAAGVPFARAVLLTAVRLDGADFRAAAFLPAGAGDVGGCIAPGAFRSDDVAADLRVGAFFAATFALLARFAGFSAAADLFTAVFLAAARAAADEAGMAAFLYPRESQTCG